MREPKRINQILGGLGAVWQANPDWRFGQLIENLYQRDRTVGGHRCIFNIEDDKTIEILRDALRTNRHP